MLKDIEALHAIAAGDKNSESRRGHIKPKAMAHVPYAGRIENPLLVQRH
jgi:hypothetical protein